MHAARVFSTPERIVQASILAMDNDILPSEEEEDEDVEVMVQEQEEEEEEDEQEGEEDEEVIEMLSSDDMSSDASSIPGTDACTVSPSAHLQYGCPMSSSQQDQYLALSEIQMLLNDPRLYEDLFMEL